MLYCLPCQFLWKPGSSLVICLRAPPFYNVYVCSFKENLSLGTCVWNHCIKVTQLCIKNSQSLYRTFLAIALAFPGNGILCWVGYNGWFHFGSISKLVKKIFLSNWKAIKKTNKLRCNKMHMSSNPSCTSVVQYT